MDRLRWSRCVSLALRPGTEVAPILLTDWVRLLLIAISIHYPPPSKPAADEEWGAGGGGGGGGLSSSLLAGPSQTVLRMLYFSRKLSLAEWHSRPTHSRTAVGALRLSTGQVPKLPPCWVYLSRTPVGTQVRI